MFCVPRFAVTPINIQQKDSFVEYAFIFLSSSSSFSRLLTSIHLKHVSVLRFHPAVDATAVSASAKHISSPSYRCVHLHVTVYTQFSNMHMASDTFDLFHCLRNVRICKPLNTVVHNKSALIYARKNSNNKTDLI